MRVRCISWNLFFNHFPVLAAYSVSNFYEFNLFDELNWHNFFFQCVPLILYLCGLFSILRKLFRGLLCSTIKSQDKVATSGGLFGRTGAEFRPWSHHIILGRLLHLPSFSFSSDRLQLTKRTDKGRVSLSRSCKIVIKV